MQKFFDGKTSAKIKHDKIGGKNWLLDMQKECFSKVIKKVSENEYLVRQYSFTRYGNKISFTFIGNEYVTAEYMLLDNKEHEIELQYHQYVNPFQQAVFAESYPDLPVPIYESEYFHNPLKYV
jgi:hypothetical protein